jgi:mono/diheme cytochrome c family protein
MRTLVGLVGVFCLVLAGCGPSDSGADVAEMSPEAQQGQIVFKRQCAVCHNPHSTEPLHGPGLKGVLKKQYLPSGIPATDDHVRQTIQRGRAMMPPLGRVLDEDQINDVIAYLHTL